MSFFGIDSGVLRNRLLCNPFTAPGPPVRWRIISRNVAPPQRYQIAPLVRMAAHLRTSQTITACLLM